ncbi:hypothetical protein LTR36_000291 [Oleoguttula mirabilis]|uniref:Proteasome assembly chaperone 3 n=1 Tax=Oleoguttula mirabilis TaxID=1507867 RepID=A0AAV9JZU9_9PEZI|nr:hypothetical protein LTR36_000291 [Oleoguttula mirabilis]
MEAADQYAAPPTARQEAIGPASPRQNAADRAQPHGQPENDGEEGAPPSFLQICVQTTWLYTTLPFRWLSNTLLSYHCVYVLSVHDLGCVGSDQLDMTVTHHQQPTPRTTDRESQTRTLGIFTTGTAARVALTEVLGLPEYAGRKLRVAFVELGEKEPGAVVTGSGGGSGDGGRNGVDEGIVALIEKMYVRSSGI